MQVHISTGAVAPTSPFGHKPAKPRRAIPGGLLPSPSPAPRPGEGEGSGPLECVGASPDSAGLLSSPGLLGALLPPSPADAGGEAGTALDSIANFAALGSGPQFRPSALSDREMVTGAMRIHGDDLDAARRSLARMERWALKAEAVKALGASFHRLGRCNRFVLGSEVEVWHSQARNSASYRKLETCANVWCCPVCSARISEHRRSELTAATAAAKAKGWQIALLTVTFRHGAGDDLADILPRFTDAWRKMTSWKAYKAWSAFAGLQGYISATEVTHGANGWHPHRHILLFLESGADLVELERQLYPIWDKAVRRAGLPGTSPKCFKLHDGNRAADYVSKFGRQWTEADELTKSMAKRGRQGNRTPWDLLRSMLHDDDEAAAPLFKVYAEAFKGKSQLRWSRGLRDALGLAVELDDEAAEKATRDEDARLLAALDRPTWRRVYIAKAQGQLLEVAASGCLDTLMTWLAELPDAPPPRPRLGQPSRGTRDRAAAWG